MFNTLSTVTARKLREIYRYRSFSVDTTCSQDPTSLAVTGQCGSSLTVSRLYSIMPALLYLACTVECTAKYLGDALTSSMCGIEQPGAHQWLAVKTKHQTFICVTRLRNSHSYVLCYEQPAASEQEGEKLVTK
jgi:hypothetical protein